jgi:hypothetical protein
MAVGMKVQDHWSKGNWHGTLMSMCSWKTQPNLQYSILPFINRVHDLI